MNIVTLENLGIHPYPHPVYVFPHAPFYDPYFIPPYYTTPYLVAEDLPMEMVPFQALEVERRKECLVLEDLSEGNIRALKRRGWAKGTRHPKGAPKPIDVLCPPGAKVHD